VKEQRVLFINLPALPLAKLMNETASRGIRVFPFGILYLSAMLKKQKHSGRIACVDYLAQDAKSFAKNLDEFIVGEAVNAISGHIPDILAFSLSLSSSYDFFCHCLLLLKKIWPKAKVIVGGMHASNAVEFLLDNHDVDYVLAGEGEKSFPLLLACLSEREERPVIKGVHWRGAIRYDIKGKPEIAAPIDNLNLLPLPDWGLLKMDYYTGQAAQGAQIFWEGVYADNGQQRHASLLTTRGCPFNCTFCASHSIHARKMRVRDVQNVIEEMRQLNKSYAVNCFHIFDDLALYTTKRALELLSGLLYQRRDNRCPD
jgi:anaerobic magnesium-protoporphyrin IX monomethyl ester cyclase